jgi:GNAT superfamily N-acetyltransferase
MPGTGFIDREICVMSEIIVRDATHNQAGTVMQMIRHMVADMANHGGYAPATDDAAWRTLMDGIAEEINGIASKYLIAASSDGKPVGAAGGRLIDLHGAFAPMKTLHISAVYVLPQHRRSGIGTALLEKLIDWGRAAGAIQCDLNVLAGNPADALYRKHGFSVFELKLVRSL